MKITVEKAILILIMFLVFIAALWLFRGCGSGIVLIADTDSNPDDCAAACNTLMWYACPEGQGSPGLDGRSGTLDDVPCTVVCRELLSGPVAIHPKCVSQIQSCAGVAACAQGAPQ